METTLRNTLLRWQIVDEDTKKRFRAFSHVATNPDDVEKWVTVTLPELGEPVAMDRSTVELLNNHDVTISLAKAAGQSYVREIAYKPAK